MHDFCFARGFGKMEDRPCLYVLDLNWNKEAVRIVHVKWCFVLIVSFYLAFIFIYASFCYLY